LRLKGVLFTAWLLAAFFPLAGGPPLQLQAYAQNPTPPPAALPSPTGYPYAGTVVHSISFRGASQDAQTRFAGLITQAAGTPLDREAVRSSLRALYATGRFAEIQAEAEPLSGDQVDLIFVTVPNRFVGDVSVETAISRPSFNQLVNATKLSLGEPLTEDKMTRALSSVQQLLRQEGYYQAKIEHVEKFDVETQQADILLRIEAGPQAHVGEVKVTGDSGFSQAQVQDIARLHPGDRISSDRLSRALQRLRKKYKKQNRLLAQVAIAPPEYQAPTNAVDYSFQIDRGPTIHIGAEGYKISKRKLKDNVPVYEEGSMDDDLLNEGRHNLLDYLQSRGYFDARVGIKKESDQAANQLGVVYAIEPNERHKLAKVEIQGNKYFDSETLRAHMQIQPSALFSHGKFSQGLLNADTRTIEGLYRSNGFRQVQVKSRVVDNYEGDEAHYALFLDIEEGPQTKVGSLTFDGNHIVSADQLTPLISSDPGQPFSEAIMSADRDTVLNYYFNHGFPDATLDATFKPDTAEANRMDVTFTIQEGRQFFVNRPVISGLVHTRLNLAQRELQVQPGSPLSQEDMLSTQRRLYGLGIFSEVATAEQNPDGDESSKYVLVNVHEAKRYTFDYGLGFEFQTGQPGVGSNQPQGNTGVTPRVSFAVTRLNFRGRDQSWTFKTNVGNLQQRALISFDDPRWVKNLRLSLTAFYDNTVDVTTYTSQRLEGSAQLSQQLSKASTLIYRFVYRRVKATNVVVASDQIPLLSQPTRVGIPGFSYIRDKRDNPISSTEGNYTTVDGGVASTIFGSETDFGRFLVQNSTYQAFGKSPHKEKKFVFARSTRIGIQAPFANTIILAPGEPAPTNGEVPIPLAERFLSGGGSSHRGFGLNQAGPRDPVTGFPLGGSAMFINNLEVRMPPLNLPYLQDNVSLAIFHDAGNVFTAGHDMLHSFVNWKQPNQSACMQQSTALFCSYDYISQAVGVGVYYKTPIGPVRLDFGYNLTPPAYPSTQTINNQSVFVPQRLTHFNVFFSIGQTF
jgi:outer membrane protein assembly complex protein YaeT